MDNDKPNPKVIEEAAVAVRRARVFALRVKKWKYARIAEEVGCSTQTAWVDVKAELARTRSEMAEDIASVRAMETASLDYLETMLFERMEDADTDTFLKIIDRVLKVKQRLATMLGLDLGNEPDKILALSINVTPDANVPLRATFVENLARSVGHPPTASDVLNDLRIKRLPEKIIDGNGRGGNGKV